MSLTSYYFLCRELIHSAVRPGQPKKLVKMTEFLHTPYTSWFRILLVIKYTYLISDEARIIIDINNVIHVNYLFNTLYYSRKKVCFSVYVVTLHESWKSDNKYILYMYIALPQIAKQVGQHYWVCTIISLRWKTNMV